MPEARWTELSSLAEWLPLCMCNASTAPGEPGPSYKQTKQTKRYPVYILLQRHKCFQSFHKHAHTLQFSIKHEKFKVRLCMNPCISEILTREAISINSHVLISNM